MTAPRNSDALFDRLYEAAVRAIAANGIGVVGKDGRSRNVVEWIAAQGDLATILREIGGAIPMHADDCAARKSPVTLCDCLLRKDDPQ